MAIPEFLREGRAIKDCKHPDRLVIGTDQDDGITDVLINTFGGTAPHVVTDITSAEMIKYASNAFLATRISFINEIAAVCDAVGASIDVVSDGLALDSRMGGRIHAGIGYGGSCLPKDLSTLELMTASNRTGDSLLRSVIQVNQPQWTSSYQSNSRRSGGW